MDVVELIRKAGRRFGDSNNVIISQQDFFDFINDAQLAVFRETGPASTTTAVLANAFPWSVPSTLIEINRVTYGTTVVNKVLQEDLPAQPTTPYTGLPNFWYYTSSNSNVSLFPTPPTSDVTVVSIEWDRTPTQITSTATPLDVPVMHHEDLVHFVVMRCHERNENWRAMELAFNEFNAALGKRTEEDEIKADVYNVIRDDPWDNWS